MKAPLAQQTIQQAIARVLTEHGGDGGMTAGQIRAVLRSEVQTATDLDAASSDRAVSIACERLAKSGNLLRVTAATRAFYRYALPRPRYEFVLAKPEGKPEHWVVLRDDVHVIGKDMTEPEARVCAAALNEHDRKVRALRQGGSGS